MWAQIYARGIPGSSEASLKGVSGVYEKAKGAPSVGRRRVIREITPKAEEARGRHLGAPEGARGAVGSGRGRRPLANWPTNTKLSLWLLARLRPQ